MVVLGWMAAALMTLGACGMTGDFSGTSFRCDIDQRCPPGFRCVEGTCLAGESDGDDAGAGGDAGPRQVCGTTDGLRDDFESGAIDPVRWNDGFAVGGGIEGGEYVFRPDNQDGLGLLGSSYNYTFDHSRVSVRVEPPDSGAVPNTDVLLQVDPSDGRVFQTRLSGSTLFFEIVTGDPPTATFQEQIAYQVEGHAHWQIRHAGDAVFWETSSDGLDWVAAADASIAPAPLVARVVLRYEAEQEGAGAPTARLAFDDLNAGQVTAVDLCPVSQFSDGFSAAELDLEEWFVGFYGDTPDCAAIVDDRLSLTGDCIVSTYRAFDARGGAVTVEVVQPGAGDPRVFFWLQYGRRSLVRAGLVDTPERRIEIEHELDGDLSVIDTIPFAPTEHRWWRFRHQEGSPASLFFGLSPDGVAWDEREVDTGGMAPDLSHVQINMSTLDLADPRGSALLDNLNRPPR
jgi:hypothetical protein